MRVGLVRAWSRILRIVVSVCPLVVPPAAVFEDVMALGFSFCHVRLEDVYGSELRYKVVRAPFSVAAVHVLGQPLLPLTFPRRCGPAPFPQA